MGADRPSSLYVDGERVVAVAPADGHRLGQTKTRRALFAGRSCLLMQFHRGAGGLGFSLLLCGQPGCLPLGVHYRHPDEAKAALGQARCAGASTYTVADRTPITLPLGDALWSPLSPLRQD